MNNEERDQHLYKYPNGVLRNRFGIQDAQTLDRRERQFVQDRIHEGPPGGKFDLAHLKDIHRHLFQDVYEWAGDVRQVDFHKGNSWFHPHDRIEMGMADVHKRLSDQNFLRGLSQEKFAAEAAEYIGDVNRLHPFREGNGRTQFQYLKQLGAQAGHEVDLTKFERDSWIQASIEANKFETQRMADCIAAALTTRDRRQDEPAKLTTSEQERFARYREKFERGDNDTHHDQSPDHDDDHER